MDIFAILSLIGGLALFLYGMNVMGDGLTKVSGGKLEKSLEKRGSTESGSSFSDVICCHILG